MRKNAIETSNMNGFSDHEINGAEDTRILEGKYREFPGSTTLMHFFQQRLLGESDPGKSVIQPESTALIDDEKFYTFLQLEHISSMIAEVIREELLLVDGKLEETRNPDGDDVFAVCIPPSDKLIFVLFGIVKLGGAYVPIDVSFPEERVEKIVNEVKPRMIISDPHKSALSKFKKFVSDDALNVKVMSMRDLFEKVNDKMTMLEKWKSVMEVEPLTGKPNAGKTAIVLYTSGSSGEPKGVRLSHTNVMNRLDWQWKTFPYVKDEKCVFKTSLTFVDSVSEIFGPLLMGVPLVIFGKTITSNPNLFMQRISDHSISRVVVVPSLLKAIFQTLKFIGVQEGKHLLKSVKMWVCSGETLTKNLVQEFFEYLSSDTVLANFYGSTEIMGDVTYIVFNSKDDLVNNVFEGHVPLGASIFNTVIYILGPNLEMKDEGQSGEIYVAGHNVAEGGYVAGRGNDKFIPNPYKKSPGFTVLYKTGDFGRIVTNPDSLDRFLMFEGRIDSQIKVRGQRVDLSEIENAVLSIDFVQKGVVLCYKPGLDEQAIVAFVVLQPPNGTSREEMEKRTLEKLHQKLRDYEMPLLRTIEEIPHLVNGKTDRQRLLRELDVERDTRTEFHYNNWDLLKIDSALMQKAKALIETMSEVTGTGIHDIVQGFHDSFYNLGGTSLNSIVVLLKLQQQHGFTIDIRQFVEAESIGAIIDVMVPYKARVSGSHRLENGQIDDTGPVFSIFDLAQHKYTVEKMTNEHEHDVIDIIASSFSHKGDLEAYTHATYDEFKTLMESLWSDLVQKGYSFVVRRKSDGVIVSASLNFDADDEPNHDPNSNAMSPGIKYVFDMLESIETPQMDKLPKGKGKLLHGFMMGTCDDLDGSDNVFMIQFMEEMIIRMAMENKFQGIFTTNTNPLTKQIGLQVHGYKPLFEYQVNEYVAKDGVKPFLLAPDTFKVVCCWKQI